MKNYDGILIVEPEETHLKAISATEFRLAVSGNPRPVMDANMVIAKTQEGFLVCLKSKEKDNCDYTQAELQEIVDVCETEFDLKLLLML